MEAEEPINIQTRKLELQGLLKQLELAVKQPRLYISQYFDDLKNQIDIKCCQFLDETNRERVYEHQSKLIGKVNEFESLCLKHYNEDVIDRFHMEIQNTDDEIKNKSDFSAVELDQIEKLLSTKLLNIDKALFQNKCMFFIQPSNTDDKKIVKDTNIIGHLEYISMKLKTDNLFGLLVFVEDHFIESRLFNNK